MYAFSHGREIGVDVEAVHELRDADEIAARFFSRREHEAYLALDAGERAAGILQLLDAQGSVRQGARRRPLLSARSLRVSLAPGEPAKQSSASKTRPATIAAGHFIASCPDPGWSVPSLCGSSPTRLFSLRRVRSESKYARSPADESEGRQMGRTTPEAMSIMKRHVTFSTDRPREASAEFRIGVRSLPYLADHGFQDMVVLPGSFYIEMALGVDYEVSKRVPSIVQNVTFYNPVILSAEDTVIKVEVSDRGGGRVEYAFYEAGVEVDSARPATRQYAAKLEIDRDPSTSRREGADAFSIEAFQEQSHAVIDSEQFYRKLGENGNQYGPRFQNVLSIWRAGNQSLGRLSAARRHAETEPHSLHPSLLDSVTQPIAPFLMETGKTFILRLIDNVEIMDVDFPDTLWGHATLTTGGDGAGNAGNIRVFDQSGRPYLELSGVAFSCWTALTRRGKGGSESHRRVQLYRRAAGGHAEFLGRPFRRSDTHRICALQPDLSAAAGHGKRVSPEQRRGQRHPVGAGGMGHGGAAYAHGSQQGKGGPMLRGAGEIRFAERPGNRSLESV